MKKLFILLTTLLAVSANAQVSRTVDADRLRTTNRALIVLPSTSSTVATLQLAETLLQKTLISPVVSGGSVTNASIVGGSISGTSLANPTLSNAVITSSTISSSIVSGITLTNGALSSGSIVVGNSSGLLSFVTSGTLFQNIQPLTTKGDLLAHNGASATRLAVGTDGYVLTASSTAATGLEWKLATAAGVSAINTYSVSTALTLSNDIVIASGTITLTLPLASAQSGKVITVQKGGVGAVSPTTIVTVAASSSDLINGADSNVKLFQKNEEVRLVSDGTGWKTLNENVRTIMVAYGGTGGLTTNCGADPCTIYFQTGEIERITRHAAAQYTMVFRDGACKKWPHMTGRLQLNGTGSNAILGQGTGADIWMSSFNNGASFTTINSAAGTGAEASGMILITCEKYSYL